MESFTPVSAAIGGALIGFAAVLLMTTHGRIAGISGILSAGLFGEKHERGWRLAFIAGLIAAPLTYQVFAGAPPEFSMETPLPLVIAGGLIVGFGTRLGSGCTSGHGVCGISRLSPRSIVATLIFMFVGMATVSILRPLFGA